MKSKFEELNNNIPVAGLRRNSKYYELITYMNHIYTFFNHNMYDESMLFVNRAEKLIQRKFEKDSLKVDYITLCETVLRDIRLHIKERRQVIENPTSILLKYDCHREFNKFTGVIRDKHNTFRRDVEYIEELNELIRKSYDIKLYIELLRGLVSQSERKDKKIVIAFDIDVDKHVTKLFVEGEMGAHVNTCPTFYDLLSKGIEFLFGFNRNNIQLMNMRDSLEFIELLSKLNYKVIGIDTFLIKVDMIQPFMRFSPDYSNLTDKIDSWKTARNDILRFSESNEDFVYEIVYERKK